MISIIVCGRNDGYGINLHKRTAISLNCLAALCEDENDEIIYVDCNTPEHDQTLTEAIADTLTPEARKRIKTFRITGAQMLAAIGETPLPFSDELSRNIAIRRSNPANRWILCTNCDLLMQPIGNPSFHALLSNLKEQFYLCPRLGLSADVWQMLNRSSLEQITDFCNQLASSPVRFPPERSEPWLRFSSVGDFQLAPREQWFKIRGCEEGMKLWGHSDANNARRLAILNGDGRTPDLGDLLRVYHLDHRVPSTLSETTWPQNDWKRWITDVTRYESVNPENWGLADQELKAITLRNMERADAGDIVAFRRRQKKNPLKAAFDVVANRFYRFVNAKLNAIKK